MGLRWRAILTIALILPSSAMFDARAYASDVYDMVFPVVGENYYSDTFGAPRSGGRTHQGIDIMSPKLTPVVAVADGVVSWVGSTCCYLGIAHDDGWESWYIHLNNDSPGTDDGLGYGIAPGIAPGVRVRKGQLIGWVGDSGNAEDTGSHVHFELHEPSGTAVDPYHSLLAASTVPATTFPFPQQGCDFDGDGYHDLAVGVPGSSLDSFGSGATLVYYGNSSGPSSPQVIGPGVGDAAAGSAFACGDFNADSYDDLAVGLPAIDSESGGIVVYMGSSSGLPDVGSYLDAASPGVPGAKEAGDRFGSALAAGDFDGDSYDDLAIGVPYEDVAGVPEAGSVVVLFGGPSGLEPDGQVFSQLTPGVAGAGEFGDRFGYSLLAVDLDGDSLDELVVGIPFEDIGSKVDAGVIQVFAGSFSGISFSGEEFWSQATPGILGSAESDDRFGWDLAALDVDQDGYLDLFVAVPGEDIGRVADAGYVQLIRGGETGLTSKADRGWHQNSPGIAGVAEAGDRFGEQIAVGDFNGDGFVDLLVGTPGEALGDITEAGITGILFGGPYYEYDITDSSNLSQSSSGIPGSPESGDLFGAYVGSVDLDGDGVADLGIGAPGEDVSGNSDAGYLQIMTLVGSSWGVPTNLGQISGIPLEPNAGLGLVDD